MPQLPGRLRFFLTTALLASTAGCVPVAWLPDSSGFVYTDTKTGRLMHCDVNKKKLRVVATDTARALWPALSPSGNHVAVAMLAADKKKPMQVIIYDLQGKELRRSPEFAWGPTSNDRTGPLLLTGIYWAGDKIIVHDFYSYIGESSTTGIFDLKKDTMTLLKGRPAAFGGTPFRPDGKGFLMTIPDTSKAALVVVDWQGKVQAVNMKQIVDRGGQLGIDFCTPTTSNVNLRAVLTDPSCPPLGSTSRWRGNVAEVIGSDERLDFGVTLQIDTDRHSGTMTKNLAAPAKVDGSLIDQQFTFAGTKVQVRVVRATDGRRLELVKAGKTTVLKTCVGCLLSPSPNGKWVAIREYTFHDLMSEEVLVMNQSGEIQHFQKAD